jgi:hypothetical protein
MKDVADCCNGAEFVQEAWRMGCIYFEILCLRIYPRDAFNREKEIKANAAVYKH